MKNIKKFFGGLFSNLFTIGDEKISGFGIAILFLMDIFILYFTLLGINHYQSAIDAPSVKYPYNCRKAFTNPSNIENYDFLYKKKPSKNTSPICYKALNRLYTIFTDSKYIIYKRKYHNLTQQLQSIKSQIETLKHRYDTSLLEKIAKEPQTEQLHERYKELIKQQDYYYNALKFTQNPIASKIASIKDWLKEHKEDYLSKEKRYKYWYFFIRLLDVLKFVFPLMILFGAIYLFTKREDKKLAQIFNFASKHIIAVLLIPVVWKIFELIYITLPLKFLEKLLEILLRFNLLTIAYYIVIVSGVLIGSFLLYWLVKKQKIYERAKRIKNIKIHKTAALNGSFCINCRSKVNYYQDNFCKVCGRKLLINCRYCNNKIPLISLFCHVCGKAT